MKIKHLLLSLLLLSALTTRAAKLGQFETYAAPVDQAETKIAFIDQSETSLKWLTINSQYLVKNKIPVLLISGSESDAKMLHQHFNGLLVGIAPKPAIYLDLLFEQLTIKKYPAVVENGMIWQVKP